jgi:soluble cytochrome b562
MKTITLFLALSVITCVTVIHADADTPLEKQMQVLARGMKQLSLQITDPAKQHENMTLIESLKQATATSKELDPRKTSTIPKARQEKFLTEYRALMDKLTDSFNRVEEAVKAGQYDLAKSALSSVNSVKKEGHGEFKAD